VQPRTGTEAYSWHLIRQLTERDAGHRYRLYFNGDPGPDDLACLSARAEVRRIAFPRLWTHARLSAEMLLRRPDLLFVPSHVLPIIRPRRCVVTVHDLGYLYWPDAHPPRRRLYLDLSTRFNAAVATLVIADSAATMRDLVVHYGTPPERIRVVHLGCGPEFRPQGSERVADVRARYCLPPRFVLTVGSIHPRKNLVRLIDAFAAIRPDLGDVGLVFVGRDGWGAAEVHARARMLGDAVRFLDFADSADMPALYTAAEALAFPSLHEGFGLPAVEAMACGTPVVAAEASSLPEVVGDAGILAPPADTAALASALRAVLTDADLRARLRAAGLSRAAGFTWERCADGVSAVLAEALGG
jgi:glycosyltransferase involved in cell wall biosynthesis